MNRIPAPWWRLVTLVYAGLPELWDRMLLRRNRSLWSRIHTRVRLPDPEPSDTIEYVHHRLSPSGVERDLVGQHVQVIEHVLVQQVRLVDHEDVVEAARPARRDEAAWGGA